MIIDNPTMGAGRGKIGGLVAYPQGSAQIMRQGFKPKSSPAPRNLNAQMTMRQAAIFWNSLSQSRKDTLAAYAASVGAYSGYSFWLPCIMRAIVANGGVHYNCLNFQPYNFNYHNWVADFISAQILTPNWQLTDQSANPIQIDIVGAYPDNNFNNFIIEFQAHNQQSPWYQFWNSGEQFGIEIDLKLMYRQRTGSIRLFISNSSEFANVDVFQQLIIQDMNVFWSSFLFPPELAERLSVTVNLVSKSNLYMSSELGTYTRLL